MQDYNVALIGGGLAGLTNALCLAKAGLRVILIEKQTYPFHRVCGEYISNEALPFLQSLGIDPFAHGAVALRQFRLSSPRGSSLEMPLDLGGFGISRYRLDTIMAAAAQAQGASISTGIRVNSVSGTSRGYQIITEGGGVYHADLVIGAYGKRANLDQVWGRTFFSQRSPYLGIKYHVRLPTLHHAPHPADMIALHNFKNGYCGISRVEDDIYCLCYLVERSLLRTHESIPNMEQHILLRNPFLADIWRNAEWLWDKPKVINEVSFAPKSLVEDGVLMCGDAAGMIAPLCGNGMAMAIHSAKILSTLVIDHFQQKIDYATLCQQYHQQWRKAFAARLRMGRLVQRWFGNPTMTEMLLQTARRVPMIARGLMRQSHGKVF